jgi:hypothetical protein
LLHAQGAEPLLGGEDLGMVGRHLRPQDRQALRVKLVGAVVTIEEGVDQRDAGKVLADLDMPSAEQVAVELEGAREEVESAFEIALQPSRLRQQRERPGHLHMALAVELAQPGQRLAVVPFGGHGVVL